MDGNHKLVRYGIYIHGCIDGFSRYIIYLKARTNNTSITVLRAFTNAAISLKMIPTKVRGDHGGENVLVADFMFEARGSDSGAYIGGQSKYNTRIERLWRDERKNVFQFFIELFGSLESEGMNINNDGHIFVLQFCFLPLLQKKLDISIAAWNVHKIATEKNLTPVQLLWNGRRNLPTLPENIDLTQDIVDEEEDHHINQNICPLNEQQLQLFKNTVQVLHEDDDKESLKDKYVQNLNLLTDILSA